MNILLIACAGLALTASIDERPEKAPPVEAGKSDTTVVYEAEFFARYNPVTVNDTSSGSDQRNFLKNKKSFINSSCFRLLNAQYHAWNEGLKNQIATDVGQDAVENKL